MARGDVERTVHGAGGPGHDAGADGGPGADVDSAPGADVDAAPDVVDVVVVGSGAAGQMAAAEIGRRAGVVVLTDRGLGTSASAVAQGGLQLPADTDEARAAMRSDMLASGGDGVDPERVRHFVDSIRPAIDRLVSWGLELDRGPDGTPLTLSAGGLSEPRIVTSGRRIGPAVLRVLRDRLDELGTTVRTRTTVVAIRPSPDGQTVEVDVTTAAAGAGAAAQDDGETVEAETADAGTGDTVSGAIETIVARSVIVATGGRSFDEGRRTGRPTSNPTNRNESMHDVLRGLGIDEVDPDLFQYHPYGIVGADGVDTGVCVPESIVAFGGRLVDDDGGALVDPTADRAQVVAAMRRHLGDDAGASGATCRLSLDGVDEAALLDRYPHLRRLLDGRRRTDGTIPVRPVLHYQLGGFVVGPDGSTTVPGLFLAGEITGGLHGRNRLMGNGITEAVVDGWSAARAALARVDR